MRAHAALPAQLLVFAVLVSLLASCGRTPLTPAASSGTETTAFTHVHLVTMIDDTILEDQTVLVEGTKIIATGPADQVEIPDGALVIDGTGAYLMPGLADMHMHTREDWLGGDWPVSPLDLYLANGVTTIRDFGPAGETLTYALRWRDEIKEGKLRGPTIYGTGQILRGPVEDPQAAVQELKDSGFDFVKLYSWLSREEFEEAIATAKQLGMYTAGHIPFAVGLDGVLSAGMDEIAHVEELDFEFIDFDREAGLNRDSWLPFLIRAAYEQTDISRGLDAKEFKSDQGEMFSAVVGRLQDAKAPVCTTLVVGDLIVLKLFEPEAFLARPENRYLPQRYLDAFLAGKEKHQQQFAGVEDLATFKHSLEELLLTELHRAGVPLLLSTDAGTGGMGIVPGFSIHDELRILTENGFTPYEALATGTVKAAEVVERMIGEGGFGTIEVGNRADLILVQRNPLQDVTHLKELLGVMAAGKWYPRETLDQMLAMEE